MIAFILILVVKLHSIHGLIDQECTNADGTLAANATDCFNIYGDFTCGFLYPDNDPLNPMAVGSKNERPIQCFSDEKSLADASEWDLGVRLEALVQCPQKCGYCCIEPLKPMWEKTFDCVGSPAHFCEDILIGNLLKRHCPEKCGVKANGPKSGH